MSFNLGVELGQLVITAIVPPVLICENEATRRTVSPACLGKGGISFLGSARQTVSGWPPSWGSGTNPLPTLTRMVTVLPVNNVNKNTATTTI
jgi:hypothetical protein